MFFADFPLEKMLIDSPDFTEKPYYELYRLIFKKEISAKTVTTDNRYIGITEHGEENIRTIVAINYSSSAQKTMFNFGESVSLSEVVYGSTEVIAPCDACIFRIQVR